MKRHPLSSAYSLIEVVIAGAILMITIAAAAAMALTVVTQQETNTRISCALNYQEQAAHLYQLGLSTNTIAAILPPDPSVTSLIFQNEVIGPIGNIIGMQSVTCEMTFTPNPTPADWTADSWVPGNSAYSRTSTVMIVRPTFR